jgi:ATP-dependent Clp protease adapter protein ClpS
VVLAPQAGLHALDDHRALELSEYAEHLDPSPSALRGTPGAAAVIGRGDPRSTLMPWSRNSSKRRTILGGRLVLPYLPNPGDASAPQPLAREEQAPMAVPDATTTQPEALPQDVTDEETAVAPPWMTILHNCDCHTFEEVVKQLMKAIACSEERGWELAWQVHNTGKAVVKVGAETECVRVGNVLASIGLVVTVTQS